LPDDLWGKDEDYLWYSTGDAANFSDLTKEVLGEATLQTRYIRGAFHDKPFTLGKYESTRIRAAIAELAANGGAPMGFYTSFKDPEARREIVRYYTFLRQHESLYRANRPHGEVLLLFPRSRVQEGDVAAVSRFKAIGKRLLDAHVLFDVLPDDRTPKAISLRANLSPSDERGGRGNGGEKAGIGTGHYLCVVDPADTRVTATNVLEQLPSGLSRFEEPMTVRVSASRPGDVSHGNEVTLHFVNYNREEPADKRSGRGIKDEKPIAAPPSQVDLRLGAGQRVARIEFLAPEAEQARALEFEQGEARLRFRVPEFLVYGVVRIELSKAK
jgi:hypothetical protein